MFDVVGVWAVFSAGTVAVISLGFPCQESPWKLVALWGGPAVSLYVLLFAKVCPLVTPPPLRLRVAGLVTQPCSQ